MGQDSVSGTLARSHAFYYRVQDAVAGRVESDARASVETVYNNAWTVLKRCPNITLKRSRIVVPMFLKFLRWQYYAVFVDDPELPFLYSQGLFSTPDSDQINTNTNASVIGASSSDIGGGSVVPLSSSVLKKRLEMFLTVFAAVTSPKSLYLHQSLFDYYCTILSKPETSQVKLAFDCMLTYKPVFLMSIRENMRRFMDDKKIRDELVVFDPSLEGTISLTYRIYT